MNLDKLIAVSGMPGIFKMAANRSNGLILENIDSGKKRFYPSRKHQFTPLESISIYTLGTDTVNLDDVFRKMQEQAEENPPVSPKESGEVIRNYFTQILPEHDKDKVYVSDIKKLIKWYNFLSKRDLLKDEEVEDVEGTEEAATEETDAEDKE